MASGPITSWQIAGDTVETVADSTLVLLPGKSRGQRSLVGYSPWGLKESDAIERLHVHIVNKASEAIVAIT